MTYWVRRFIACNPCYLVSAALLLYGFYRLSIDPGFLRTELAQLTFDMSSLQVYEVLLVVTAIWLARRAAWYDAAQLVCLENAFVFVPFILISQAGLIDQKQIWYLCFGAALLAGTRFYGLKRWIKSLNFPARFLAIGLVALAVNTALPIIYRILHESKVGTKPTWGAAFLFNEYAWILLLPAVVALGNLLPAPRQTGPLLLQRRWLPSALFPVWFVATAAHLYCLGYVYDFDLRPELVAPALFVLLWTTHRRANDFVARLAPLGERLLLVGPFLVTFLAVPQPSKEVFILLTFWNLVLYGARYGARSEKLVLHLFLLSLAALVGGLPQDWIAKLPFVVRREHLLGAALLAYVLMLAARSRDPRWALTGGAMIFGTGIASFHGPQAFPASAQAGLVFLLVHSLRWEDGKHAGARALRGLVALIWVGQAFASSRFGATPWINVGSAAVSLGACLVIRLAAGRWGPLIVPIAALLVLVSGPAQAGAGGLRSLPSGLLAIAGSFVLFACGTAVALTRQRWHPIQGVDLSEPASTAGEDRDLGA